MRERSDERSLACELRGERFEAETEPRDHVREYHEMDGDIAP